MPVKQVITGDVLFDMHDWFSRKDARYLDTREFGRFLIVRDSLQIVRTAKAHEIVQDILYELGVDQYTNKYLVALNGHLDSNCDIQAIYSYDGLRFGLVTLRLDE